MSEIIEEKRGNRRRSRIEIEKLMNELGYELLDEYSNKDHKQFVVLKDILGYKYDISITHIFKHKPFIFYTTNKYTLYNISNYLKINKKSFYLCKNNEYKGSNIKLKFHCKICNNDFDLRLRHLITNIGCCFCAGKKVYKENSLSFLFPNIALEWLKSIHNLTPNDVTPGSGESVLWKCSKCDHEWTIDVCHRCGSRKTGCPACSESKGEKRIIEFFNANNILFKRQYQIKNCKNKRVLSFDFYLPKYNLIIEYDGILHFYDKFDNPKEFKNIQLRDKIKNKYCKNNDLPLLRIKYTNYNKIEVILTKELSL